MRLTPEQEAAYSLDFGVSRADLKPQVQAEYDRLLAYRRAERLGQTAHQPSELIETPAKPVWAYTRFWILMLLAALAFTAWFLVMAANTKYSFQMLRSDTDAVRLPSGYRLVTVSRSATCTGSGCWLIETSTWSGSGGRADSAACSDVYRAMASAYPPRSYGSLDGNPPQNMPGGTACDYFTVKGGPGFTKVGIEALVRKTQSAGAVVELVASNDCYDPLSRTPDC